MIAGDFFGNILSSALVISLYKTRVHFEKSKCTRCYHIYQPKIVSSSWRTSSSSFAEVS